MSSRAVGFLQHGARSPRLSQGYICPQCRVTLLRQQQRNITQKFKARIEMQDREWQQQATEIRAGKKQSMLAKLESRGFVNDIAGDRKSLDDLLIDKRIGVYCGIDPTAPSLHVGHMVPLMSLFWMYIHGYHSVSLIGGGTARIGDPTGRTTDRPQMTSTERKANMVSMHYQVKKLWKNLERLAERHGYMYERSWRRDVVNNAVWWNSVTFTEVLKYMGNGLRLGTMLSRDTVKRKMESGDGMSFAEFCYPIMQAWDWWRIYDEKKIQMQIGGADQYGNIVAGLEAVKYVAKTHPDPDARKGKLADKMDRPAAFTVPLLTTASGDKFGKSAGNAVWLDQSMTSLFELYAFWVNTADADVERYLKLFTFLPLERVRDLMVQHKKDRAQRQPQHTLAHEFIQLVHGLEGADKARKQYLERAEQRKTTNLTALMSSAVDTEASSDYDWKPQAPQQPAEGTSATAPPQDNPLAHNQNPVIRQKAQFWSQKLNPFAPQESFNEGGGPARVTLPKSLVKDQPIARVLHSAGLVSSRSEGHRLAQNRGAYYGRRSSNKEQMSDDLSFRPAPAADASGPWENVIRDQETGTMEKEGEEGILILRVGKWKVRVVRVVSDELYESLGLPNVPGWSEHKSILAAQRADDASLDSSPEQYADTSFVEPTEHIGRKNTLRNRDEQRKDAMDYFHNEAVRRRMFTAQMGRSPQDARYRLGFQANFSRDAAREASSPGTPMSSQYKTRLGTSSRQNPTMTPTREARIMAAKRRMIQQAHREGSQQALETLQAEQKSSRELDSERMTNMRNAHERGERRSVGRMENKQLASPSSELVQTPEDVAAQQEALRKREVKVKEMEAAKARRKIERERLVGGMIDRGWWKDTSSGQGLSAGDG